MTRRTRGYKPALASDCAEIAHDTLHTEPHLVGVLEDQGALVGVPCRLAHGAHKRHVLEDST
jgi:hypothetical protein